MTVTVIDDLANRLTTIKEEIVDMVDRLLVIKEEYQAVEKERERVSGAVQRVSEEMASKKRKLSDMQGLVDELKQAVPEPRGDEKVCLDVGGRAFKMYRSTLSQYSDTVLEAIVSTRWLDGARNADGSIFLDMNPNDFEEISNFLRARRINPKVRSNFSPRVADLATYLGVPVDHINGSQSSIASFARMGDNKGWGLAFSIAVGHPSSGIVRFLEFDLSHPTMCSVYAKSGEYTDSLARPEDWATAWAGELEAGWNCIPFNLHVRSGQVHSLYLHCSTQALKYSNKAPASEDGQPLVLTPGRAFTELFKWPVEGGHSHLNTEHRYFAGKVRYSHYMAACSGA